MQFNQFENFKVVAHHFVQYNHRTREFTEPFRLGGRLARIFAVDPTDRYAFVSSPDGSPADGGRSFSFYRIDLKTGRRDRDYTNEFSGTSSASPIVAGAAVLLQSHAKREGRTLTPREVRELLQRTGSPQAGNTGEQIGPRPDLRRALEALGAQHEE